MRTIRTKIYKFEELSAEAQSKAIDNFRNINTSDDFWFDAIFYIYATFICTFFNYFCIIIFNSPKIF